MTFSGFDWDYGGAASWEENGETVRLQLSYSSDGMESLYGHPRFRETQGDREVRSDHPVIRMMNIWVSELAVRWGSSRTEVFCE